MRFRFYPLPFISLPLLPRVNAESEAQLLAIQPNFPPFVETKQFFARAPHPRISNHPAINFPPLPQLPSYRRASVRTHLNLKQEQDFKFIFEILGNEWPHKFLAVFFFVTITWLAEEPRASGFRRGAEPFFLSFLFSFDKSTARLFFWKEDFYPRCFELF